MNLEVNESGWKFLRVFWFGVFQGIEQKAGGFSHKLLQLGVSKTYLV